MNREDPLECTLFKKELLMLRKYFFGVLGLVGFFCDSSSLFALSTPKGSPIFKFLKTIEITEAQSGLASIDSIYVINLDERPEKWLRTKQAFNERSFHPNRVSAVNGWKLQNQKKIQLSGPQTIFLSGGEIGCFLSHVSVYQDAVNRGFNTVWICEDDIVFREGGEDIDALVKELSEIDRDWDVLYTDYTTHGTGDQKPRPGQPFYEVLSYPVSDTLLRIHGRHCLHSVIFSKSGLMKILKYFQNLYLWSPIDVDIHYVPGLKEYSVCKDVVTSLNVSSDTAIGSCLNPNN